MKKISKATALKKTVSLLLSFVMILVIIPVTAAHADDGPGLAVTVLDEDQLHDIAAESVGKLPDELLQRLSLRDADIPESMSSTDIRNTEAVARLKAREDGLSSLVYVNRDGTVTEYFFSENVKYEKEGNIYDKSNRLTASEKTGGYTNEENDINVTLPFELSKSSGIALSYKDHLIGFTPVNKDDGKTAAKQSSDDTVVYENAFGEGMSLEYTAQFSGVKENVIIAHDTGVYEYAFVLKTHGLYLKAENGVVLLLDEKGEEIAQIGGVLIYDEKGKPGEGSFKVTELVPGEEYVYTISVSEAFMKSDDTAFPVTVDPTITFNSSYLYYDSSIESLLGTYYTLNSTCQSVSLGRTGTSTYSRMLIKFPSLTTALKKISFDNITSINLTLYRSNPYDFQTIDCYRMTHSWSSTSGSTTYDVWNGYDSSSGITGYFVNTFNFCSINIKSICEKWIVNNYSDYGIMIKLQDESLSGLSLYTKENASGKPVVSISYTMPSNIEDVGLKEKHLYKIKNTSSFSYIGCNRSNSGTYSVSLSTTEPSASSTLENSVYFALYKDGNSGYFKLTPTNANYRGSKELWNTTEINYLYYDGSSVGISSSYKNSNKSSWYVVMHNDGKYFILNRYYPNVALNWFLGNPSVSTGEVSFSSVSHKWEFIPVGLDVPLIMQSGNNNCGAAAVLQSLCYLSLDYLVTGTSYVDKMNTIYPNLLDGNDVYAYKMIDYINSKYSEVHSSNTPYVFRYKSNGESTMISKIKNCINTGFPAILNIVPLNNLKYYTNYTTDDGHYIIIVGYSDNNYIVRDCNRLGSGHPYFGEFIITEEELCKAYGAIAS